MDPVRHRIVPTALGFFLVANTFLVPGLASSPRATDPLGLLLGLWWLVRAHRVGVPAGPLALLALAMVMPVVWLGQGLLDGEVGNVSQAARWVLAVPWALTMLVIMDRARTRAWFIEGLVLGCGVGAAVVMLQVAGFDGLMQRLGLSAADAAYHWVYDVVRVPGMHGHPNASSAVISLIAPAAMVLYLRHQRSFWVPIGGLLAMLLAMHLTSTRSPLVVSAPVVAVALLLARRPGRALPLLLLLAVGGTLFLATFGPPGGAVRWDDMLALQANVGERVESNRAALDLMLEHPFGLGPAGGRRAMIDAITIPATHNAFLQAGLYFGWPLLALLLGGFGVHAVRLLVSGRGRDFWAGLMAVQVAGLFMFEEHLNNPTFVIIACWLLAASVPRPAPADAEATPPAPGS